MSLSRMCSFERIKREGEKSWERVVKLGTTITLKRVLFGIYLENSPKVY